MIASGASVADVARVVRPSRAEPYSNYFDPAIPVVIAPDMVQQEKGGMLPAGLSIRQKCHTADADVLNRARPGGEYRHLGWPSTCFMVVARVIVS